MRAREVQKVKILSGISYAEAVKRVNIEKRAKAASNIRNEMGRSIDTTINTNRKSQRVGIQEASHSCKVKEGTMLVEKVNFVAFICKVVYIGLEQNDRKERVETIIEAAKEYLGISMSESKTIQQMMNPLTYGLDSS